MGITKRDKKLWGISDKFQLVEFQLVNPTSSDVTMDLFNPNTLVNVPNSPYGYAATDPTTGNQEILPTPDIAPNTYQVVTPMPFNSTPVIYDTVNNKLWGGEKSGSRLFTYADVPSQSTPVTTNIISTLQSNLASLSFSTTSNKIIAVCNLNGYITILNATTEAVITNLALAFAGYNWVEYNSTKDSWYLSCIGADFVVEISASTNAVLDTIALPAGTSPMRMAFNSANNNIYVAGNGNDTIVRINCATNAVSAFASPVTAPYSIGINNVDNLGYVGSNTTAGVWIFSPTTNAVIVNVLPTARASHFQYYSATDKMYIANPVANVIYVLDSFGVLFATVPYTNIGNDTTLTLNATSNIVYASSDTALATKILNSVVSNALVFYINGSSSEYNKFLRDIANSPAWTTRIVFYSNNQDNINQVVTKVYKNPDGLIINIPLIPSLSISMAQYQGGIAKLDFPEHSLVLGINEWFQNFFIQANSQISLVLLYQQIDKSAILIDKTPLQDKMDVGFTLHPQLVDEKEMENATFGNYIPIDEKNYSKIRKNLISPFDLTSFNKVVDNKKFKK